MRCRGAVAVDINLVGLICIVAMVPGSRSDHVVRSVHEGIYILNRGVTIDPREMHALAVLFVFVLVVHVDQQPKLNSRRRPRLDVRQLTASDMCAGNSCRFIWAVCSHTSVPNMSGTNRI
jgi:hypothetical protein